MLQSHFGEIAALLTAFFWTVTALFFESASKKVGSLTVNLLRLLLAFIFLGFYSLITNNTFLPIGASLHAWIWLGISGLIGFVIGDFFLFKSYTIIGARIAMLIMALAPPIAALFGWMLLGETMSFQNLLGMAVTITGIGMVVITRNTKEETQGKNTKILKFKYSAIGLLFAFLGATGQAVGLVLSKFGMKDYDAFAATQIRVFIGIIGFSVLFTIMRRWKNFIPAIINKRAFTKIAIGAFFGPFLGVSFSLLAIKYTTTGIASTIMAIVPVLIIPPAIIFFKEKISIIEIIGAAITVSGGSLFFIF